MTKSQNSPYEDDDALLVVPCTQEATVPRQQELWYPAFDILTVDDLRDCLGNMIVRLRSKYCYDSAWKLVDRMFRVVSAFKKERGFLPASAPSGEHIYPLYSREKFPPKSHQAILRSAGSLLGVTVHPKKDATRNMRLSYTGVNLHCFILDMLGQALMPAFDVDLRALYRGCLKMERPQRKERLVVEYIDRIQRMYDSNK